MSPAKVTLGDAAFAASNTLTMELGGLAPGSQHDQLQILGTAQLDGALDVTLINGFNPTAGDYFSLFNGNTSGAFQTVNLPGLSPGLSWDSSLLYSGGTIGVTAVPEPGTLALCGAAALCVLTAAARRRRTAS